MQIEGLGQIILDDYQHHGCHHRPHGGKNKTSAPRWRPINPPSRPP